MRAGLGSKELLNPLEGDRGFLLWIMPVNAFTEETAALNFGLSLTNKIKSISQEKNWKLFP